MREIHIEKGVEKNLHSKLELKDVQHLCVPCCASEERIKRERERARGPGPVGVGGELEQNAAEKVKKFALLGEAR
jgi:hypothetical protein